MRILRIHSAPALLLYLLVLATINVTGASAVEHMPPKMNYQGHLTDTLGKPLAGPCDLTFRLYDAQEGGNLLWIEDHPDVLVDSGIVNVVLGSTSPITADIVTPTSSPTASFFDVFLEVTVNGEILQPRTLLASTPYALMTGRVDGDITTAPGDLLLEHQVGLSYEKIRWRTGGGESDGEMESSDGFSITKVLDKATPLLYQSLAMHKSLAGSDSLVVMGLIESDTIWWSMAATDGPNATSKIDKSSPKLFESEIRCSDLAAQSARIDKSSPKLMESTLETGEGLELTKTTDKSTPALFQSMVESTDGASITKVLDKASPKLACWNMSVEKAEMVSSDSVVMAAQVDTGSASLSLLIHGVASREEISLSTGPGSEPVSISLRNAAVSGDAPTDTNVVMYATAEGGSLAIAHVGGTPGDGMRAVVTDAGNSLRLRHGGANTGVYVESAPSTGGRIGINNEAPGEALQVSGNICASGVIGACSDVRFKDDIHEIPAALDQVSSLRGVSFSWKQDEYPAQHFASGHQIGFVAQEVLEILPEVVLKGGDGYYSIDYGKLTPLLVEAIKELKAQNEELRRRMETLEQTSR